MEKNVEQSLTELYAKIATLEQRINDIEVERSVGGIYLENVPRYAKDYINQKAKEAKDN